MKYNPEIHHRKSIRIKEYDYSQSGYYFVTICVKNRLQLFGKIENGEMILNEFGVIVEDIWFDLPNHILNLQLDYYYIMPNHLHCIFILNENVGAGSKPALDTRDSKRAGLEPAPTKFHGLSEIIRQFKTFTSKQINILRNTPGVPIWQRNYYEHIIRNE
jgi:REP element-mobilizing transposase RayT